MGWVLVVVGAEFGKEGVQCYSGGVSRSADRCTTAGHIATTVQAALGVLSAICNTRREAG